MLNLIQPQFFVPIHGDYRPIGGWHARIAQQVGLPADNILVVENGLSV